MKKTFRPVLLILALTAWAPSAQAQVLVANFQADDYTTGSTSFVDTEGTLTAHTTGTSAPVGNGTSITTTNGGFYVDVSPLDDMTSYSIAVGFTYLANASAASNGSAFYDGTGVFGNDLTGIQGDSVISINSLSSTSVELTAGGGSGTGNGATGPGTSSGSQDENLHDTAPTGGNFVTGAATGAVFVVNAMAGTMTLYVNGVVAQQITGLTILPFGKTSTGEGFDYGIGYQPGGVSTAPLDGDITQAQIYDGALSASQAELLSTEIDLGSVGLGAVVPEPSTWALMLSGLGALVFWRWSVGRRATT
jgi:hypothetical protein